MEDKRNKPEAFNSSIELSVEELDKVNGGLSSSRSTYRLAAGGAYFKCECGYIFEVEDVEDYAKKGCPKCKGKNAKTRISWIYSCDLYSKSTDCIKLD